MWLKISALSQFNLSPVQVLQNKFLVPFVEVVEVFHNALIVVVDVLHHHVGHKFVATPLLPEWFGKLTELVPLFLPVLGQVGGSHQEFVDLIHNL